MTLSPNAVLSVEHLTMRFGGLIAIDDLSFEANPGEITAIIGPNGAGKTTVFNCITGFYKPTEGMLTLRHPTGRSYLLERMFDYQISSVAHVARTFQNIRLFGGMTVLENLLVAQHNPLMRASNYTIGGLLGLAGFRKAQRASIDKSRHWLEKIDLIDRADDPASDLPYGDQRRLEIARAMCTDPVLLCLDEPAAGLNPSESAALNKLLLDIRNETSTSVLLIEHDMSVVMEISDHVVVLDYGKKISDGSASHVQNDPAVIAAYLGVEDEELAAVAPVVAADIGIAKITKAKTSASKTAASKTPVSKASDAKPSARKPATASSAKTRTARPATRKAPARKPADKRPAPRKPTRAELQREDADSAARLAKLPAGASALDKANAVGRKPRAIPQARKTGADDLKRIKGIGPANEKKLNELGFWHFDQIAQWERPHVRWIGTYLAFPGRIDREDWVRQAHKLAKGVETEFSARVARGDVASSKTSSARPAHKPRSKGGRA